MLGAAAAVMIAAAGSAPEPFCAALAGPAAHAAPVTVRAMLAVDMVHGYALLSPPPGQDCASFGVGAAKGSQAAEALNEIDLTLMGVRYAERHGRRGTTYLRLKGLTVTATGTVVCEPDARCWVKLLELRDVVYPDGFKNND